MEQEIDDYEWTSKNESEWYVLQKKLDELLSSDSRLHEGDYEVSATRDDPSTIDVLLLSNKNTCKAAIEDLRNSIQQMLAPVDDHWCVRFFVRAAHEVDSKDYQFYLWLFIRRALVNVYFGRYTSERWEALSDFEQAIWPN